MINMHLNIKELLYLKLLLIEINLFCRIESVFSK